MYISSLEDGEIQSLRDTTLKKARHDVDGWCGNSRQKSEEAPTRLLNEIEGLRQPLAFKS